MNNTFIVNISVNKLIENKVKSNLVTKLLINNVKNR